MVNDDDEDDEIEASSLMTESATARPTILVSTPSA
jgi:hypothetical protein